ncbi:MAG: hypothetical protein IT270_18260 [Saprospiraceae bacterium]|nr:hypothetical protein [Saprospiraceae bacterium]
MSDPAPDLRMKIIAFAGVAVFFVLTWLYVREFPVFSNTVGINKMVFTALLAGLAVAGGIFLLLRKRLTPVEKHMPEFFMLFFFIPMLSPLVFSLLNRAGGNKLKQSFEFVAETPYLASAGGILKGEKIKPTGWHLYVRENQKVLHFKYKTQAYYPITKPGEAVLLPMQEGLLGYRVMLLR